MKRSKRGSAFEVLAPLAAAAMLAEGCSAIGTRGSARAPLLRQDSEVLAVSTVPARAKTRPVLAVRPGSQKDAGHYADLGPETVDISNYPIQQRYNYEIFAKTCSRCHTLARSINSARVTRAAWNMYVTGMRSFNALEGGRKFGGDDTRAIVDFLVYDSKVRKIEGERDFTALTKFLEAAYEPILREKMSELQKSNQPIYRPPRRGGP